MYRLPLLYHCCVFSSPYLYHFIVYCLPYLYHLGVFSSPYLYHLSVYRSPCLYHFGVYTSPYLYQPGVYRSPCLYHFGVYTSPYLYQSGVYRSPCLYHFGVCSSPYLYHLGVQPLAHLHAAVSDEHRAVSVDVNQGSSLQHSVTPRQQTPVPATCHQPSLRLPGLTAVLPRDSNTQGFNKHLSPPPATSRLCDYLGLLQFFLETQIPKVLTNTCTWDVELWTWSHLYDYLGPP